jgi:hypothetical protein
MITFSSAFSGSRETKLEVISMKKLFVLVLLGLVVCLISGCCNTTASPVVPPVDDVPDAPEVPDTPTTPDAPTTHDGPYLTWDSGPIEIYVTRQPIDGVTDYQWIEPGTGDYSSSGYYYSTMGILIPYATKWSDGSVTLSLAPYGDVNYDEWGETTAEFNDTSFVSNGSEDGEAEGTEPDVWYVGTAAEGRTKADYTYDSSSNSYVYNGGSTDSNTNTPSQPETIIDQIADVVSNGMDTDDSDTDDVTGDINSNDGLNISNRR